MSGYWIQVVPIICVPFGNGVEPSGVQALKNPNPLKDAEG